MIGHFIEIVSTDDKVSFVRVRAIGDKDTAYIVEMPEEEASRIRDRDSMGKECAPPHNAPELVDFSADQVCMTEAL